MHTFVEDRSVQRRKTVYYCPKCDSEDVEIVTVEPPADRVPFDRLGKDYSPYSYGISSSLMQPMPYVLKRAVCKGCGFTHEYKSHF